MIHTREADGDTRDILANHSRHLSRKGVIHSFTSSLELAEFCLAEGFMLGFNGITTFRNAAEESGTLARAASGALDHLPYLRVTNLARAIETLQQEGICVAGLAGDGDMAVADLAAFDRLAIVLGAEGSGLRRLSRDHCDQLVRIDIDDQSDSLNVSNAAAIALYAASQTRPR